MTTFSYPIDVKRPEMAASGAGAVLGAVPAYYATRVTLGAIGSGAVGTTTIPLFVAPAGSRVFDCIIDVITPSDQGASNTNIKIGTATSTAIVYAATTANTAGRRTQTMSGAQVSANAITFTADTTIQAIVSVDTSAATTFDVMVYTVII